LGTLGTIVGLWGLSWAALGSFGRLFGSSFGALESSRGCLDGALQPPGGLLGPLWRILGVSWESLGSSWHAFGGISEARWKPFGAKEGLGKRLQSIFTESCKSFKNHVRYCKNRGLEGLKIMKK